MIHDTNNTILWSPRRHDVCVSQCTLLTTCDEGTRVRRGVMILMLKQFGGATFNSKVTRPPQISVGHNRTALATNLRLRDHPAKPDEGTMRSYEHHIVSRDRFVTHTRDLSPLKCHIF